MLKKVNVRLIFLPQNRDWTCVQYRKVSFQELEPKIMRTLRLSTLLTCAALLSACSGFGQGSPDAYGYASRDAINHIGTYNVFSTAVTMGTDKTVLDHIVSFSSGKDCSTVRTEQGRTYCREDELNPAPNVHCYRSLADVTCYAEPSASRAVDERVGTHY